MPHDLPLPSLTGQIPYDVEDAIDRLRGYSVDLNGAQETLRDRLATLQTHSDAAQAALDRLAGGAATLLVAVLDTTRLDVLEITLEGFTPNSVLFVGAGAFLTEDPPNFTWDSTARQLEVRGALTNPGVLRLTTAEPTVVTANRLGQIDFQAPVETSGGDALLVGASIWAEAAAAFTATVNATDIIFATAASETALEQMRLTTGGALGIGTPTPVQRLHVNSSGVTLIRVTGGAANVVGIDFGDAASTDQGGVRYNNSSDSLTLRTNGVSDRLFITSTGDVGIGTAIPDALLSLAAVGAFGWLARARLLSPADGVLTVSNAAETAFTRLNFGGMTSSFPALTRSSATLHVKLADDSAFTRITALGFDMSVPQVYTIANPTTDRALDVTGDTLAQGLAVLGTLLSDLQTVGLIA